MEITFAAIVDPTCAGWLRPLGPALKLLPRFFYFRSTRIQLGPDRILPVNSIASTMMKVYPLLSTSFCCPLLVSLSTIWYVTGHHRVDAGLAVGVQMDRRAKIRH